MSGSREPGSERTPPAPVSGAREGRGRAGVGDEGPGGGRMAEAGEARTQRAADAGERSRAHPGHGIRHLDHHAVRLLQAIDEVRLERAAPGADLVVEEAGDR